MHSSFYTDQRNRLKNLADSFPVPTYLFFKGDERLGRNDVKVAGQAGKGKRKVLPDFRAAFPRCNAFQSKPPQERLGTSLRN